MGKLENVNHHNDMVSPEVTVGDLKLNRLTREVTRGEHRIPLQTREYLLLEYLFQNQGQVVTREMLLQNVWHYNFDPQTNVVDVHISRLRAKLDKPFETASIETVRGKGYRLVAEKKYPETS